MQTEIKNILNRYKTLLAEVDKKINEVTKNFPGHPCKNKCFECCEQLFPLSFVEAYYISEGIKNKKHTADKTLLDTAALGLFEKNAVDKKTALNTHGEFARFLHSLEIDCPALNKKEEKGACTIYELRNHDCRSMGASFDASSNEIIGCRRFNEFRHLAPKLMNFSYLYPEKMMLDRELIGTVTNFTFPPNILYLTTMQSPLAKDYSQIDWSKFFTEKNIPKNPKAEEYWVVIDA